MFCPVAVRGTVASRIQPCDSSRAGSGASLIDCDGGSRFRSGLCRRLAAFARASSASGILLLLIAGLFAASPALAQSLSVGINSNGTGDATGVEGDALTFTVKMSATKGSNVTLKWRFVPGTAGPDGAPDYSYDGSQNLTISTGSTSTNFVVDIADDARHEDAETFEVEIYDAVGATISRSKAQVTINVDSDNPDAPEFRVGSASADVDEDAGWATVTVQHWRFLSDVGDITIPYTVVGITATDTLDFDATGGTVTFARGRLETRTIRIPIVDDADVESDETFEVRFGVPSVGSFSTGRNKRVVIRAQDEPAQAASASISSSPASGSTYGAGETITVSLAMNEDVLVTGRPWIQLDVGGARRRAVYSGPIGEATDALEFSYVVQSGDVDADGVTLCALGPGCGSIQLAGGSVRAVSGDVDALLRLPALAAQAGHKVDAAEPLPMLPTACSAEIRVPSNWALKPSSVAAGSKFRLLFVTSTGRNAVSSNIDDYNLFVQERAAAGHETIQDYSAGFRAVASTSPVDARDNTCTTGTGVQIHWLDGNKVADNYGDFYDDSWDDQTNQKNESGNSIGTRSVWTGSDSDGTGSQPLGGSGSIKLGFIGQSGNSPLSQSSAQLASSVLPLYGLSQVFVVPAANDDPRTTDISIISTPAIGDTYRLGETVEIEVTYSEAVTVRGTPAVGLSVKSAAGSYDNEYEAAYVRGSGTTKLVFAFTVPSGLKDTDGIRLHSDALRMNGATIAAVSDGLVPAWNLDAEKNIGGKVDSALTLSGGICDRTPQVRDAIVTAVTVNDSNISNCSQVTETHLAAVTGFLTFDDLTSIGAGDLAGLSGIEEVEFDLDGGGIETLPAGLFDGLGSLTSLGIKVGLTHLPKDIFRGLGDTLTSLILSNNQLAASGLPDGIFEPLTKLTTVDLIENPGFDSFRPTADAGPGGTISAGQTVTLGGPGTGGGPWGSNATYGWTQTDGDDMSASTVTLSAADVAKPDFTVPALASATDVKLKQTVVGRGDSEADYTATSTAKFTIRALAPTGVAVVSEPVDGSGTYKRGETIEFAVTFGDRVLVDTSLGTPALTLLLGSAGPRASYVRGSGTNRLVFEHTVKAIDTDTDGISVRMNRLALHGGAIASVYGVPAILTHAALAAQSGHKVDGSSDALTGGICGRTAQVRDKLVALVRTSESDNTLTCAQVGNTHLGSLTGKLDLDGLSFFGLNGNRMSGLKAGDFAGLTGITTLALGNNRLRDIPAGVFDPLTALTSLELQGNGTTAGDGLTRLPAGLFDRLTGLTELYLQDNDLSSLPPRIFEKLTNLIVSKLSLGSNPGSADFVPTAKAGPTGGIEVVSGGSVTLGVEGAENGYDDPWGANVTYSWARIEGADGTLTNDTVARAAFTAPATDGTHVFRLTVTGRGGVATTADIIVRVAAGPQVEGVAFASQPTGGNTPVYAAGETIEVAVRFDREVTVGGTPSVTLDVGGAPRAARYLDGSGSRALTFGYVVQQADTDLDGVDVMANSLALNGGEIVAVSDGGAAALGHKALAGGSGQTANGRGSPVTGGVCSRTPAVAAAIVEQVRANEGNNSLTCDDITDPHLEAITGRLDLSAQVSAHGRMTALKAGDFADLTKVTALDLDNHALRSFPAGIFAPLTALTELSIAYNQTRAADRLTSLPVGLFAGLTNLRTLRLEHNDLESLPDGIFEKLTNLTTLTFNGNPGSATFLPVAVAGPEGGIDAKAGETVTLGGDADGPWGNNLVYSWRKATGTTVDPSAPNIQMPTFTAPGLAAAATLEYELTVTARGTSLTATGSVTVRVAAAAVVSSVALVSTPVDGGDTYKSDEKIGAAVTFSQSVTVTVTETEKATLDLTVGTNTRQAEYVRGTGTNRLVFEYTVVQADADSDGISIGANSLALATGAVIVDDNGTDANLDHTALAAQSGHKVDGSGTPALTGGICERTAQVRDKLVALVRTSESDNTLTCAQVGNTRLGSLTGKLDLDGLSLSGLNGNRMSGLKADDFAGLTGITTLALGNNQLRDIPARVFDPLTALTSLELQGNGTAAGDGLTRLPAGLFDRLTGLTELYLQDNDLSSLPPRIFEKLTNLIVGKLSLGSNPGSADFVPTAKAGPTGGIEVVSGGSVTLGVEGAENGYDDLWGANVTYSWARTEGTGGTLTNDTAARAAFTAPATDGTHVFRLTVTGRGGVAATATVNVRVGITPGMEPMPVSAVVDGETLTLTYGEALQETAPASASDKGQVYLAVVSEPGARRNIETARPSAVEVKGRQVILNLDPPADFGDTVTLSYYPDNATAASRVRDLGGNLADGFTGFSVRNETPEGNTPQNFAFTGPAKTYRIGDTIGIELTFAEAVIVTGAPTLALEIGAATRKAAYVRGSGSAVLTFEATAVALGEEDTDGIAVEANGLEVPAGGSILNTADREAAILRHGRVNFPDRKVDGVRPTATAASAAGPTVTVTWSEALDEASVSTGTGGFRIRIGNANGPAVSAAAVSRSTVTLSLESAIADGTTNVTLEYTPPSGAKIRDAASNDAAAILRADALAVTVTPDTRAPELAGTTVDGATLRVTFDEALDTASVPAAPGGFTATVTRGGNPVSGYTVSGLSLSSFGTVLTLTLAQAVRGGDTVTLAYTKPTTPLRDRASTPNDVADFSGRSVDNLTPSVKGLPVFAGAAKAYVIGDRIAVEVEFTEAVSVASRPEVAVEVGANTRKARYVSGTGSARLRFEYEVVAGDADTDGIAILADALATPGGSAIRTRAGNRTVQLAHDEVPVDSARTVDGERPTATTATAEGLTIEVTWSEALDADSAGSGAGGFRVRIGTGNGPVVTAVAVDGTDETKLRLTLASVIADGTQDATLEYRPPSSGAKIRDAAGNDAERFTGNDALAVSVTPDTTAPMLAGKPAVNGTRLTLAFDEPLDEGSVPAAAGGFTVTVTRDGNAVPGHTVTDVAVSGPTVTLTLAQGVLTGDTVTLAYSPTSTPLRDRAVTPNDVAAFSGQSVDNGTDALEVSLSTTDAVEGEDGTVTLTVAVAGGGTSGVARAITIAPVASPTAAETEDWTLAAGQRSRTLSAGRRSATAEIVVVDDARLEPELAETVSFDVTADGAPIGTVTLSIDDDDKAVLVVTGPAQPVTEGQPFELKLRLEPHPENVSNVSAVANDVCFLDFPVSATLTRAGDTAALPSGADLETDHSFAATSFGDCTREVTVSVPTLASDGVWKADRALTFALAPKTGSDPRVEAGEELQAVVRDDTPPPGPIVTEISISPGERTCERPDPVNPSGYSKEEFLALPLCAVHDRGTTLTFTLTFDSAVTVTLDTDTRERPELVLDVFGRERRAQLSGNRSNRTDTRTLTFTWAVLKGDNDPDGIRIATIDLKGASIRFAAGCTANLPCDIDIPLRPSRATMPNDIRSTLCAAGCTACFSQCRVRRARASPSRSRCGATAATKIWRTRSCR